MSPDGILGTPAYKSVSPLDILIDLLHHIIGAKGGNK